ncbi:MAG: hypothetical protein RSC68_32545, partial [Acinetobacter sp.]
IHNLKVCTIFDDEKNEYFASDVCDPSEDHIVESINLSWRMWQAAKAQAAPEGFVLVERSKLLQILGSAVAINTNPKTKINLLESDFIIGELKAMIKAQEPTND